MKEQNFDPVEFAGRVSKVEGGLEQLTDLVTQHVKSTGQFHRDLTLKIDTLTSAQKPNLTLMIQFGALFITLMGAVAWHFHNADLELDAKLQQEYRLMHDGTTRLMHDMKENFREVNEQGSPVTRERLTRLETRSEIYAGIFMDGVRADLQELRLRRKEDVK